jgi:hypothetical protein
MKRKTLIEELEKGPEAKIGLAPYNPGAPEYVWTMPKAPKKKRGKRQYLENS